jgi:hypothetical protein
MPTRREVREVEAGNGVSEIDRESRLLIATKGTSNDYCQRRLLTRGEHGAAVSGNVTFDFE